MSVEITRCLHADVHVELTGQDDIACWCVCRNHKMTAWCSHTDVQCSDQKLRDFAASRASMDWAGLHHGLQETTECANRRWCILWFYGQEVKQNRYRTSPKNRLGRCAMMHLVIFGGQESHHTRYRTSTCEQTPKSQIPDLSFMRQKGFSFPYAHLYMVDLMVCVRIDSVYVRRWILWTLCLPNEDFGKRNSR